MSPLIVAVALAMAATVYSLVCGVSSMVSGKEVLHHSSEQWMMRRIGFQALALVLLMLAVLV